MYGKTSFGVSAVSAQPKIIATKIPTTCRFIYFGPGKHIVQRDELQNSELGERDREPHIRYPLS